ncbi:MAG: ABC transporter ATP-binding protein [Candidatus Omnitrophica bacterium CG_4_9_14_0_2_um_filter_42_8]|nr:MAG: ABC transporter ATP-binding protein [Candidatus Omnitrophica bacterium CG22_combo_CG10-13_8_21_14_all_43_16]PJC48628.1 MAG: ABC transporter ATP-binding protein [Candidatus Omnitrophica bacterium CG_4_9_14_0_2_um_filter_42_8]
MIEIINLSKAFTRSKVLDNLNLIINSGEVIVIIGRSGCGKSVLLKHIIGLMKPDIGQVIIDGNDMTRLEEHEMDKIRLSFGMLFQGAALFDSMTVGENVGFTLREHTNTPEEDIRKKVAGSLELVGLKGIEKLMPAELSGGMKKRVGLARAICNNPGIILYDEPTTGLDPIMADAINDLIIDLNNKLNVTSIVVTHDMVSAFKIADRIAMLYKGKIITIGTPDDIKNTKDPIVKQFITGAAKGPITEDA